MGAAKVTISLPEELLARIDELATDGSVSRSSIIQEAGERYVAAFDDDKAWAERERSIDEATDIMKRLRDMPKSDGRPSLEILKEIREG